MADENDSINDGSPELTREGIGEAVKSNESPLLGESLLSLCFELERNPGQLGHLATVKEGLENIQRCLLRDAPVSDSEQAALPMSKDASFTKSAHELISARHASSDTLSAQAEISLPGVENLTLTFIFQSHTKGDPTPHIQVSVRCEDGIDGTVAARAEEVASAMKNRVYYYDYRDSENS
jgi:hypothetical protein